MVHLSLYCNTLWRYTYYSLVYNVDLKVYNKTNLVLSCDTNWVEKNIVLNLQILPFFANNSLNNYNNKENKIHKVVTNNVIIIVNVYTKPCLLDKKYVSFLNVSYLSANPKISNLHTFTCHFVYHVLNVDSYYCLNDSNHSKILDE